MKQAVVWKLIRTSMERNVPVMLLYVLESKGSSPGRQGFFMAVNENGDMEGSIGGGIMEHKFVEMAKERLHSAKHDSGTDIKIQVHDKSAARNQSGMICSGEQTILFYTLHPEDKKVIENIIASLEQYKNGTLTLSPSGIEFLADVPDTDYEFSMESEEKWLYKEKTGYKNELFIIGGGHCALALSRLMHTMDFYIRVYDDRKELKTMMENTFAHEKYFVDNYANIGNTLPKGPQQYVVIMTFGYRTDDIALQSFFDKEYKFIGLLGSKTKIQKMFDDFRSKGIKEKWLHRIHTPVGIDIKSQTPEEIAVSIAAEIIGVKNREG